MFKKKPNIKALSPLRSSDRRRVADQIIAEFHITFPFKENGSPERDQGVGAVRNSLLPDNTQTARYTTTVGKDLKQVSGTLYVGSFVGEELRILWVKIDERLFPTVYTLWKHPRIVPLLHTNASVIEKMRGGADLMTPGLARGPPFPAKATKGSIVAVASLDRPSVPSIVGLCEIDISSLRDVQGTKGHAVRVQHWNGDELWAWGQNGKPGGTAPVSIDGWDTNGGDEYLKDAVQDLELEDHDEDVGQGGVPLHTEGNVAQKKEKKQNTFVEGESGKPSAGAEIENKELSIKEIDDIFWNAFLYGLHHHRFTYKSNPNHGIDFPVSQSAVISGLVLPFFPDTISPHQAASLTIKKTSWKNAKKFIKALDKAKIVRSKDRDGGECVIQDIDFNDLAVTNFIPYKILKKENANVGVAGGEEGKASPTRLSGTSHSDDSIGQKLESLNLYKPKSQLAPIFKASNARLDSCFLPHEIRSIVNAYIESENLVSKTNKRLINLDPIIANAVFDNSQLHDDEIIAHGSIPRDALMDRVLQTCTPHWLLLRNSETRESVKPTPGVFHKVHIVLETRSGNKTVTKVSGVEAFYLNPQLLADELQKACASSTSVNQLAGSSPKKPVMEIMVQGPQKDAVIKALGKRGLNRQWIEIIDKTKSKKK